MSALPVEIQQGPVVARPSGASSEATVARDVAEVQGAMLVAKKFPRNEIAALDKIKQAFARPSLAEVAKYEYSRGGSKIDGPSIRAAEALAQCWGNIATGVTILSADAGKTECIAYARDLETNFYEERRFTVRNWRDTRQGGYALTDERDIYELAANMAARRKRACILAVIPGDIVEQAMNQVEITMAATFEVTPDLIKSILASFEKISVTKEQIEKKLQRRIDAITPAQVSQLKKIQTSIKDGIGKPGDYFEIDGEEQPEHTTRTEGVKAKVRQATQPVTASSDAAAGGGESGNATTNVETSGAPEPFTDEVQALLAMDKAADEADGGVVLDRCKGKPFRARIVAAFNSKFPKTID